MELKTWKLTRSSKSFTFLILLFCVPSVTSSSNSKSINLTVAIYRDQAYADYFKAIEGLSEEEALKIHTSGLRYFLSDGSLQPIMNVEFLMQNTLFSFEEYGISTDQFLNIFEAFQQQEMTNSDQTWDHAILLTGNASKPNGLTHPGGFCTGNKSSSIVKARNLHLTPLFLAQYIARNMGMEWDSSEQSGFIMTQNISSGIYKWSKRSQNFWKTFATTQKDCFKGNGSSVIEYNLLNYLPGLRTTLHQQCQAAHGLKFSLSTSDSRTYPCQRLVCSNSTSEETLRVASLPGSICKKFQYCWKGNCQSLNTILHQINTGLIGSKEISGEVPPFFEFILSGFLRVVRLVNFIYNRF